MFSSSRCVALPLTSYIIRAPLPRFRSLVSMFLLVSATKSRATFSPCLLLTDGNIFDAVVSRARAVVTWYARADRDYWRTWMCVAVVLLLLPPPDGHLFLLGLVPLSLSLSALFSPFFLVWRFEKTCSLVFSRDPADLCRSFSVYMWFS